MLSWVTYFYDSVTEIVVMVYIIYINMFFINIYLGIVINEITLDCLALLVLVGLTLYFLGLIVNRFANVQITL